MEHTVSDFLLSLVGTCISVLALVALFVVTGDGPPTWGTRALAFLGLILGPFVALRVQRRRLQEDALIERLRGQP